MPECVKMHKFSLSHPNTFKHIPLIFQWYSIDIPLIFHWYSVDIPLIYDKPYTNDIPWIVLHQKDLQLHQDDPGGGQRAHGQRAGGSESGIFILVWDIVWDIQTYPILPKFWSLVDYEHLQPGSETWCTKFVGSGNCGIHWPVQDTEILSAHNRDFPTHSCLF